MTVWTKRELEEMLYDVVNELDLSDGMIKKHWPLGIKPADLAREVLDQKDKTITILKAGLVEVVDG